VLLREKGSGCKNPLREKGSGYKNPLSRFAAGGMIHLLLNKTFIIGDIRDCHGSRLVPKFLFAVQFLFLIGVLYNSEMKKQNGNVMNDTEINAAIGECLKGNNDPYTKIIRRFQAQVYHICFHFTGTAQDAEDAAAEVFIKTFQALGSFDNRFKFSTWIFRIAVNYCIGITRKKKHERSYLSNQFPEKKTERADEETPASLFFKEVEQTEVREMLRSLPVKYRSALILKYYRDMSYRQISEILDVPKNTVASLILRGKKELRKRMKDLKKNEVQDET
jgi:RNA polymerase sigma-70 factor (ECF subfamily)